MKTNQYNNHLLVIGADGLAKQCLKALTQPEFQHMKITFFDNVNNEPNDFGHSVITSFKELDDKLNEFTHYLICLGEPKYRKQFSLKLKNLQALDLISENSNRHHCKIGDGCTILDNVLIEPYAEIGNQVLLNHGAKVFHDATVGDYCEISPGATILGKAKVGEGCRIGSNATILPHLTIGDNCIVGAGAVVTKNIPDNSIVVGVPARDI